MIALRTKPARPATARRDERVAVPCCTCGKPTSLRVLRAMLEELQIFHLCTSCFRGSPDAAAGPGA